MDLRRQPLLSNMPLHVRTSGQTQDYHFLGPATFSTTAGSQQLVREDLHDFALPEPSVVSAVNLLANLGLKRHHIRVLRQLHLRNALHVLADTSEEEFDRAFDLRLRTSEHYSSGVPSLVFSDPRSSVLSTASSQADFNSMPWPHSDPLTLLTPASAYLGKHDECSDPTLLPVLNEENLEEGLIFGITGTTEPGTLMKTMINDDTRDNTPMETESPLPPVPPLKDAQYLESRKSKALVQAPFIAQEPTSRKVSSKQKVPCPEIPCDKCFSNPSELASHILADHYKDSTFHCRHSGCPGPQPTTSRASTIKRHHTERHTSCPGYENCYEEKRRRQRKYWGCGLCLHITADVRLYAKHYQQHFIDGFGQHHIDYSTIIRSLLQQDGTRQLWDQLDVEDQNGSFISWDSHSASEVREALEYGVFRGSSLDDESVLDQLLTELVRLGHGTNSHQINGPPDAVMEDPTPLENLISQFPIPKSDWQRAGSIPAAVLAAEILRPNV
jgi:hypothetical protein